MSYSVSQKCNRCKKQEKCADGMIIRKAVEMIHNLPNTYEGSTKISAHLGGGNIEHNCTYGFEEVDRENTEVAHP